MKKLLLTIAPDFFALLLAGLLSGLAILIASVISQRHP